MAVTCIHCGADGAETRIDVDVEDGTIRCDGCAGEYGAEDVRAVIAAWGPVLDWIESHPARQAVRRGRSLVDAADPEVLR